MAVELGYFVPEVRVSGMNDEEWSEYRAQVESEFSFSWRVGFRGVLRFERKYRWYWLLKLLSGMGDETMARGRGGSKTAAKPVTGQWTVWAEVKVPDEAWPDILQRYAGNDELTEAVALLLERGYRISFSTNPQNDTVTCSLTCKDDDSPNAGMTLTSFAGTWWEALMVSCYKHYVVSAEVWAGPDAAATRPKFG